MMNKYVIEKMGEKEKQSDSYAVRKGSRTGDTMELRDRLIDVSGLCCHLKPCDILDLCCK